MSKLTVDCLNDIFEYLDDPVTLYSCLFVNRLWCKISVRIYWNNIRNYYTLIICLPNESKEILYNKKIFAQPLTSKLPMFNYASFCKVLSIKKLYFAIGNLLYEQQELRENQFEFILFQDKFVNIALQEIYKLLMKTSSIRKLDFPYLPDQNVILFTSYIGARDCLKDLSELFCDSNVYSEFFYQLSQLCHNIQFFEITFREVTSSGLIDLISVQKNLKSLKLFLTHDCDCLTADIIESFTKNSSTVIMFHIYGYGGSRGENRTPLSFISNFINLQKLTFSYCDDKLFEGFNQLQNVTFPNLQQLKFKDCDLPRNELLLNFLMNNGKNLKQLHINKSNYSINIAIIKYCPNLRKLFTGLTNKELETLKMFLENFEHLEYIKICCEGYLSEKILLDVIFTFSPKNFHILKLCYSYNTRSVLQPNELESFFINWAKREPQKSLSLIIFNKKAYTFIEDDENKKIIDKYVKLGVIKFFVHYD
ncbi:hypothetical protein RclHR1_06150002 [Rhizophagus clarus]|uniref:F-box domain-containing protein n=1 Tax=Rhizophagus clarus TaxID=94130 RepID=A0A2Z6RQX2_9GLOM|nr:hypothetical protein RclHR1_06150002 [Rhizophagus clarus]GES98898.1 hypothetical protein GLOIN_2v1784405 [Rhizophagus clarus]